MSGIRVRSCTCAHRPQLLPSIRCACCLRLLDVCCLDHSHYASLYLCRLVEGGSLKTWLQDRSSSTKADNEEQMLAIASQMFNVRRVKSTELLSATMPCNLSMYCSSGDLHQIMSSSECLCSRFSPNL